ncbi:excitatory amino acid transporter isoform X2 [Cloeon dipterum]
MGDPTAAAASCSKLRQIKRWLKKNLLLLVTVSGVFFGVVLGVGLRPLHLSPDAILLVSYPGELFMRLLKLMILPLVIASLIAGAASLNAKMNGRLAIRTMVYFLLTSLFNAALGVALALIMHPGDPETKRILGAGTEHREVNILDGFLDLGRNIFPDNLFQAAFQQAHTVYVPRQVYVRNGTENDTAIASVDIDVLKANIRMVRDIQYREGTNTLGIIFFCLVFGTVLGTLGRKARVVVEFFSAVDEVIMKMVTGVMWLTPIGVSSVIAGKILSVENLGLVTVQLGWFIFTVVLGVLLYQLVFMQLIYLAIVRRNPFKFYCGLIQATLTAFATASTAAALPVTFRCMDQKVKVDSRVSRFVLPIGATVNMDGTALFVSIASVFIAQINEIPLGMGEYVTIALTSTAASIASASVPSAALVLMLIVLTAIDAPVQDVSLLFAVDWFVDRVRTTNNMLGDCYAAAVVEHLSSAELNSSPSHGAIVRNIGDKETQEHASATGNGHAGNGHILPLTRSDLKGSETSETAAMLEVVRIQEPAVHKK